MQLKPATECEHLHNAFGFTCNELVLCNGSHERSLFGSPSPSLDVLPARAGGTRRKSKSGR